MNSGLSLDQKLTLALEQNNLDSVPVVTMLRKAIKTVARVHRATIIVALHPPYGEQGA